MHDSDEEGNGGEFPVHNPKTKWSLMKPIEKEIYESPEQLRFALTNYAVANGYPLRFTRCDKQRLQVKCGEGEKGKTCPFSLWASWMGREQSFQIKKIIGPDQHMCTRSYEFGSIVNPDWTARHYIKEFIARPNMKTTDFKEDVEKKFFCKVSKGQCSRAKIKAQTLIEGKIIDHYARLWDYANEIKRSNPGSTVQVGVHVNPDANYFHRFYVCYKALKDGWNRGCRRIIGLDGTFLKGRVEGELLIAVGRDGDNHIYPIAWAVVDIENKDNWKWFLELVRDDLGINEGMGLSIMSDQHKGLIAAKEVLPHVEHRQCARHVYANLRKTYGGEECRKLFWKAAKSTVEVQFMEHMNAIKAISVGAYEHLMARNPKSWCKAFFSGGRACDAIENGMSESFNSVIDATRKKPIITMLEEIRLYMMRRCYTLSTLHRTWKGTISPTIMLKLAKLKKSVRYWTIFPSGGNTFEARSGSEGYKVDLDGNYCTCRSWELCGYPCVHACSVLYSLHISPETVVSFYLEKSKFIEAYRENIQPLNGTNMWGKTDYTKPLPPKERRMPGRPTVKLKRHVYEKNDKFPTGRIVTCTNCLEKGHNSRSCKTPRQVLPQKEKKKPGRPRTADRLEEPRRGSRGGRSGRGSRGGRSARVEVLISMNHVLETQGDGEEVVVQTQPQVDATT